MDDIDGKEKRGAARRFVRWLVRRYYPSVEISNADRIAQSGPVLLCGNHSNALVDPILIGVAAHRPVRFMAKAPMFDYPVMGSVMHALGMIPAYRGTDDASERRSLSEIGPELFVVFITAAIGIITAIMAATPRN